MDFVNDVTDRVVMKAPDGQTVPFPWGDLMPDHVHFPDAGMSPDRHTFNKVHEQVLLFCTSPYKEYRENLQSAFVHETSCLNDVQVASDEAMNETLNVKEWTDVQLHMVLMRMQHEEGIFMTYSLFNNLTDCTSVFEGLNQ